MNQLSATKLAAGSKLNLADIEAEMLDGRTKGVPGGVAPFRLSEIGDKGWNVLAEDLPLPLVVLKRSCLENNIEVMQRYCRGHAAELAPHGKTTMAPQIFDMQLAAGAWGMTAASVEQLHVYRHFGVRRVIYANQFVGRQNLEFVCRELKADPEFEVYPFVDSVLSVTTLVEAARRYELPRPFRVLLEVGYRGGRTGIRDIEQVEEIRQVVAKHPDRVDLLGVAGFEGLLQVARHLTESKEESVVTIESHFEDVTDAVDHLAANDGLPDNFIVTAGGSAAFDKVVGAFSGRWKDRATVILRSGCYVTHDHLMYLDSPLQDPDPNEQGTNSWLRPALELWGYVHSTPEPDLALVTFGRRDVGFDYGLPVPLGLIPSGTLSEQPATDWKIEQLNDQHAYLRHGAGDGVKVGDRLRCGISHPCTTFDKWRVIPVVDDDYAVVAAVRTFF